MNRRTTKSKMFLKFLFIVYIGVLILVLVLKFPTGMVRNTIQGRMHGEAVIRMAPQMIPFKTITEYVKNAQAIYDWFVKNLVANIIMFLPYGFLLPLFMKDNKREGLIVILTGCLLSGLIEIFQYVTAIGVCDVDDVILNTFGVLLGWCFYKLVDMIVKKKQ